MVFALQIEKKIENKKIKNSRLYVRFFCSILVYNHSSLVLEIIAFKIAFFAHKRVVDKSSTVISSTWNL